jgi:sec-independent protein translocase protein TatB
MGTPPPIELGSLGMADSLILMVMALVVFGPRRLPQIGRQIGKLMYEFRKASNDFKFQMEEELRLSEDADRRKKEEEKRKQIEQESVSATPAVVAALESSSSVGEPPPERHIQSVAEDRAPDLQAGEPKASEEPRESVELKQSEEAPRILPPSTGEIVAASRTNPHAASDQSPGESANGNESPATETVSHDG